MPTLRDALPADAAALARLAESTFRETFAADNSAEDMDAHCAASYGEAQQGHEISAAGLETVLAEEGGELVGYAQLRWGGAPACVAGRRPVEISRLYVDRRWHGRGVAPALMAELLARARRGGADRVWLGVWERNPRAISFYRRSGFGQVGDKVFRLGSDPQRDLVLARPLDAEGDTAPPAGG